MLFYGISLKVVHIVCDIVGYQWSSGLAKS